MRVLNHNRLFQAAVVAAGIVALSSSDALARSHGKWGSYGSYGSSGSSASYGSASYASYGSAGSASSGSYASASYGSSGSASYGASSGGRPGLFARWHARKAAKHSYGSSGSYASSSYGSSGSYASSSYGSSGSYGSAGSSGSYGGYSAPVEYGTPVEYGVPAEAAPPDAPLETSAAIRVTLPADAQVFVNDRPTTSTGGQRSFVSRGLEGGRTYAYQLRVEFTRDGEKVVENKLVRLQAGQEVDLSFGGGEQLASDQAAPTQLTLHVPAEAKVTLAGAATHQTGETRTYATSALAAGQEWDGYLVRVELQRDGQSLVEEKALSIVGGESYELTFDFADEPTQVASLN